jgi:DinB superfamily
MLQPSMERLVHICKTVPALLLAIDEDAFRFKQAEHKWSKKQVLGHLVDSAANNHHRFVRCQFEDNPVIWYPQEDWNRAAFHQTMDTAILIQFWCTYNQYLAELVSRIPIDKLQRSCTMRDGSQVSLEFLVNDYVTHLEHHLQQIVTY